MDFIDKELKCVDCGTTFVFSAGEQAFFNDKGFTHDPKHCKQCKEQSEGGRRHRIETRVRCSDCGIDTIIPFKPTQNRPVLCSKCFGNRKKAAPSNYPNQDTP